MINRSGLIPVEFHVVVELDPVQEKTVGGIILPTEKVERDEMAATEATLVAVSPLAFTYEEWPAGARKPVVGDRVLFKRHTGWLHKKDVDGVERRFRILNDKEIVAIIATNRDDIPISQLRSDAMARQGEEYDTRAGPTAEPLERRTAGGFKI